jgi:glutamate dehydrogenase (NAD(P)+)
MFAEAGSKVIAVQDHTGTVVHQGGLDVAVCTSTWPKPQRRRLPGRRSDLDRDASGTSNPTS